MRDPSKLDVVPAAEELAVVTYRVTKHFPTDERFGLTAQIRRSAVSVGSNIVEGCHRQGDKAFLAFLFQASGSAAELEFQLRRPHVLNFAPEKDLDDLRNHANMVTRMLYNLIRAIAQASR